MQRPTPRVSVKYPFSMQPQTCILVALSAMLPTRSALSSIVAYDSYAAFAAASPTTLTREDWASVPLGVIEGQVINGVHYSHTDAFGSQLAVGNGGAWGFRLRTIASSGSSLAFGWSDRVTFTFGGSGVDSFGVMFAQGNYTDTGTSVFAVQVNDGEIFYRSVPVVTPGPNIGYLGLTGLNQAGSVTIWRVQSGANVVWSAYHIDWTTVPAPSVLACFGAAGFLGRRRRR